MRKYQLNAFPNGAAPSLISEVVFDFENYDPLFPKHVKMHKTYRFSAYPSSSFLQ